MLTENDDRDVQFLKVDANMPVDPFLVIFSGAFTYLRFEQPSNINSKAFTPVTVSIAWKSALKRFLHYSNI